MALPGRGGGGGIVGRENPAAQRRGDMSPASKEARLRVLLADDHPIVLAGVRAG